MSENPDVNTDWRIPLDKELRFLDGKLQQYQWSQLDGKWDWYDVPGKTGMEESQ